MKSAWLIALIAAMPGSSETVLPASRSGHVLVLKQVFLDGSGPFRMVVDTGNTSSLLRPEVAQAIGLRPAYTVEQVTIGGVRRIPAGIIDEVRVGTALDRSVEVMIGPVRQTGADGVLGQSWLIRHDYLLDYLNRRLVLDGPAPAGALEAFLRSMDGRPMIVAAIDHRRMELVLDSGVPLLLLFAPPNPKSPVILQTNGEPAAGAYDTAEFALGGRQQRMTAVRVNSSRPSPGLLPMSAFSAVHVSNRNGRVVLVP